MKRLNGAILGVDQGSIELFSDFTTGGDMWTGEGPRERRKRVEFSQMFRRPPTVHVAVSLWDMDRNTNIRADLVAQNIGRRAFDIVFRTWGDTRVARIRASWLALGEMTSEDDWDL